MKTCVAPSEEGQHLLVRNVSTCTQSCSTPRHLALHGWVFNSSHLLHCLLPLQDFHEALKGAWDKEQERRAAERAATGRIDFTSGSKHAAGSQARGAPPLPKPASASSDVAAVVQKARMQAAAAAAAKAKASRWGPQ